MRGRVVFVIGVSGCGKSSVGRALAERHGARFLEGDAFHPPENVATMRAGQPLSDAMRWGWLGDLAQAADTAAEAGEDVVVACSGLRQAYRDLLRQRAGPCRMVFLQGDKALIRARMAARQDHYMPPALMDSQFATLEPPAPAEIDIVAVSVDGPLGAVIDAAEAALVSRD